MGIPQWSINFFSDDTIDDQKWVERQKEIKIAKLKRKQILVL